MKAQTNDHPERNPHRMSENWKIQISPKILDDTLVNIRAESPEEMDQLLIWATENVPQIAEAVNALKGAANVAAVLPVESVTVEQAYHQSLPTPASTPPQWTPQPSQQPAYPQQQHSAAQPGPAPVCQHGQMKWIVDKGPQPRWGGFFCPAQKGDPTKCATQYAFSESR